MRIIMQNKDKSFVQRFLFKEIDYVSMLHFIFMFKDKDTAPGGKVESIYNLTLSTACLKSSLF